MPLAGRKIFGYEIREPFASEMEFFKKNLNVSGMAAEDNRIVLNPLSKLNDKEMLSVAMNEASRLYMRENKMEFNFDLTPGQHEQFKGSGYEKDEQSKRHTILGRIISGDPSMLDMTSEQRLWAEKLYKALLSRK